ncbi:hypothetical protein OG500_01195 [Kitasatospora sp. NBC_01250]|uniref:hypothetical protein n=1 Tax=unclassified Kitasatospora TaxID=2633591 RepID=UPI002E1026EE|nr:MULTISPECIES: hypothetical protein [unclassified Kitasatospora]WSJ64804.1 hypothetical protein OG294_01115 [Kitasatospora sp. NBC_01302]
MGKKTIGTAVAAAGIVAALTMGGGTAFANGQTVGTPGDNVPSPTIASNTSTHCLSYTANEHDGWNWGGFRVVDNDTHVQVGGGNIEAFSLDVTGNICGLYGKHYYIQVWGGSGFGSLSN